MKLTIRKIIAYLRWFFYAVVLAGIGYVLAPFIYPFIYPIRKQVRKLYSKYKIFFILWVWLDDSAQHDYGTDWFLKARGYRIDTWLQRYWAAYVWSALRNPAWNMYTVIGLDRGEETIISSKGYLTKNLHPRSILDMAVLKYVDSLGRYTNNMGEYLSMEYSILGSSFVWYEKNGVLHWRKSIAKRYGKYWLELHLGSTRNRYTIRYKRPKNLKVYEYYFN